MDCCTARHLKVGLVANLCHQKGEHMRLIDPATWRLLREEGLRGFLRLRTIHGYIYLRWMEEYVALARRLIPHMGPGMKNWLAQRYHGKVIAPEVAANLVTVPLDLDLHHVPDQVIPYEYARDIVLRTPREIAVIECACRAAAKNHCSPSQVCMIIGQPFVDFVEAKQDNVRRLTPEEAVDFLAEQHRLGRVHTAWFKDACMGRFYAICNCCKCCCSGAKAMREWETSVVAPSGFSARHNPEVCEGCGHCADRCVYSAIAVTEGKAQLNYDACMGCGLCVDACPNRAWELQRDEAKGWPLELRELAADEWLKKGIGPRPRAFGQILKKLRL
jgi:Fe-S-cluster-containing hydrogenase component 2